MINCQGVELIPAKIDHLSQDIFTKAPKHRLHLFGCYDRDSHDSDSQPPKSVDDLDSFGVKAKVAWSAIKAKINGGSAVLVVDGWDPDGDWFQEEDFLPDLASWHDNPIYFFDVDNDQLQDTRSVRLINKRLKEDGSNGNKYIAYLLKKGTRFTGVHIIINPICYPFEAVCHCFANILNGYRFSTHT